MTPAHLTIAAVAALAAAGAARKGSVNRRNKFVYWRSCPDFHSGEIIHYITDHATEITYQTLARNVDLEPLRSQNHPAMYRISSPDNWAISFYKSRLPNGDPIYFFDWSRIEHIFIDPDRPTPDAYEMVEMAREEGY